MFVGCVDGAAVVFDGFDGEFVAAVVFAIGGVALDPEEVGFVYGEEAVEGFPEIAILDLGS